MPMAKKRRKPPADKKKCDNCKQRGRVGSFRFCGECLEKNYGKGSHFQSWLTPDPNNIRVLYRTTIRGGFKYL